MTANQAHGTTSRVGRKKLWRENINLRLPEGAKARMDAVLAEGEDRLDMIREAIDREIARRLKPASSRKPKPSSDTTPT